MKPEILYLTEYHKVVRYLKRYCVDFDFADSFTRQSIAALVDIEKINDIPRTLPKIVIGADCDCQIEKAFACGAIEYIKKPFDFCEILLRINAALGHILKVPEDFFECRQVQFLSDTQEKLFLMFLQNPDRVLSIAKIRAEIGVSSDRSVRSRIHQLRERGVEIELEGRNQGYRYVPKHKIRSIYRQ